MKTRTIKRYENRKLYDTEGKKYISLEEIALLVKNGEEVKIIENSSGNDITAQTLTQVILEEGKQGRNPFSQKVLHDVIRWSNEIVDEGIEGVKNKLESLFPNSLTEMIGISSTKDIEDLRNSIEKLEMIIKKMENSPQDFEN